MSVMKTIYQMRKEVDIMRHSGAASKEEINAFVSHFCEEYGLDEPLVVKVSNVRAAESAETELYEVDMR